MISKKYSYKEKVVEIYEKFFFGKDVTEGKEEFWNEFFLLKTNINALNDFFSKYGLEQLMCLQPQINRLTQKCVEAMSENSHLYRIANAAQTLTCFVNGVFSSRTTVFGQSSTLINILVSRDKIDLTIQELIKACHSIIVLNSTPVRLKGIILNLLLSFVSANNLLNENPLVKYMLTDEVLEIIMMIISDYNHRSLLGKEVLFLVTLLMQYKRNENNYCRMKMSILEEQIILNGISHIISLMYVEFIKQRSSLLQAQKGGVLSSLTSAIGNFLVKSEINCNIKMTESCFLLTLFDFLQLNSHFSYIITSPHSVFQCPTITDNKSMFSIGPITDDDLKVSQSVTDLGSVCDDPTNIIAVFLEYCSIAIQDIKELTSYNNCRLCFLILLSLAEDQNTANTLHDAHLAFKVTIHRKKMRHRKLDGENVNNIPRPLVCAIIDVVEEFLLCHIMKAFPADLFNIALDVIHRLVCFQKNKKLRIRHDWKPLWNSLIILTKYLVNNYDELPKTLNVLQLINKIEVIFNIFITFGDTFLHGPTVYDDLYYEIIRMASIFDNLYNLIIRFSISNFESKEDVNDVLDHLINIRAIVNHFNPKIQSWADENYVSSLSREQILEIVTANYDSLTLKLHRNLDKYERYNENSQREKAFFHNLTCSVVLDIRERCMRKNIQLQNRLKDILLQSSCLSPTEFDGNQDVENKVTVDSK